MRAVPRSATETEARLKYLLIGTALVAVGLGAAWYGGETWLSGKARDAVAASPDINAASVTALRDPGRIGLHMTGVEIGDAQNGLSAPDLNVYAPLTAPTTMTVALPAQMDLRVDAVPMQITLTEGLAHATIAPTHEMAIQRAGVHAQAVAVDGVPMADALDLNIRLVHMGAAAPAGSRAAYAVGIAADGLMIGGLPDRLDVTGPIQLWLTEVPGQPMLEGRVPPPALTGLQTQGVRFVLGDMQATLVGRIQADAEGFAEGEAAFYTADARPFVDAAVQAGLIPQDAAMLMGALVKNLSETPVPSDAEAATTRKQAAAELLPQADPNLIPDLDQAVALPPAQKGQIRLPLILKDGKIRLGPVPIGPAPRLIAAP